MSGAGRRRQGASMATEIHPTAVVDPTAELDADVAVGPYAVVGPHVRIGGGTRLRAHAQVAGRAVLGRDCDIHPGAVVGGDPQDLKYKGEDSTVVLGDGNIVRECVTINRGTALGGGKTVLGDHNLVMAYAHIAHDCILGNRCIITNGTQLAGHIKVEDMAILSGMVAVHHFVTIGTLSFIAGLSAVRKDVPPYMIMEGNPARVRKLNLEGLKRRGMSTETTRALKEAFRILYRSEKSRLDAVAEIESLPIAEDYAVENLIQHYHASENGFQGRALEAFRKDRPKGNGGGSETDVIAREARNGE
jgi:UDP-N-acetylglucosamine acyltransferase